MRRALDFAFAAAGVIVILSGCGVATQPRLAEPGNVSSSGSLLVATSSQATTSMTLSSLDAPVVSTLQLAPAAEPATAAVAGRPTPSAATPASRAAEVNEAVALLATLAVKGRAPKTGFERSLFGPAWTDDVSVEGGRNGCDTRNDILRRDLGGLTIKPNSRGCTVLAGTLLDAYTGRTIDFTRGQATSGAVQIDHVVALMDAWQKGAQGRSLAERRDLANDPLNLQAVDGPTNAQKGAGDAATWLPPHKAYRCTYVSRQVQVKAKYRLWVTQAEKDAIGRVLATCGASMTVPSAIPNPTAAPKTAAPKTAAPKTAAPKTAAPKTAAPKTAAPKATTLPKTTVAPKTTAISKPGDCYPLSNGGNCYNAGQICAQRYRGESGVAANGSAITCVEISGGWHWRNQ